MNLWRMKDMKDTKEHFATFPYRKLFNPPLNVFLYIKVYFLPFISFISFINFFRVYLKNLVQNTQIKIWGFAQYFVTLHLMLSHSKDGGSSSGVH